MPKNTKSIPVNTMTNNFGGAISIEKTAINGLRNLEGFEQSHRHDRHSFFLLENGTVSIEIDFQKYEIKPSSVIYMHPNQVHRIIAFDNVTVTSLAIDNDNLNPTYLKLLEDITPTKPLLLKEETFSIISEAAALFIKLSKRKSEKLYHSLLKDSCNALVALVVSQYLVQAKSTDKFSRFDIITKAFKELLERDYTTAKNPETAF